MENEKFIRVHVDRYGEIIDQLKDYEQSLIKIYHYATFKKEPIEFIKDELNHILTKY